MCGFIPSFSYTPESIKCDSWVSFSAHTFASPCFGREPNVRVATLDGESSIIESITNLCSNPNNMVHMESCVNQQGPPSKAKYSWVTNSEVVPWRKGERNPIKEWNRSWNYKLRSNGRRIGYIQSINWSMEIETNEFDRIMDKKPNQISPIWENLATGKF